MRLGQWYRRIPAICAATWPLLTLCSIGCGETYRTVEDRSLEKGATVKLGSFQREALDPDGKPLWELKGKEAYIFEKKRQQTKLVAYGFSFRQFNPAGQVVAEVSAVRGEVDYTQKQLHLTGNVTFKGRARTITAQKMSYDIEEKVVTSDSEVVIQERNLYTRCARGVVVYQKTEKQICKGPAGTHSGQSGKSGSGVDDIFQ